MSVRLTQIVVWFIPYFMVIACGPLPTPFSLVQLTSIGQKWKSGEIRRIRLSGSVTNHSPSSNIAWVTRNLEIFSPVNIYGFYSKFNGAKIGSTHRWEVEIQQDLGRLFWLSFWNILLIFGTYLMNFDEFTMIERKNRIKKKADILLYLASTMFYQLLLRVSGYAKGPPKEWVERLEHEGKF